MWSQLSLLFDVIHILCIDFVFKLWKHLCVHDVKILKISFETLTTV